MPQRKKDVRDLVADGSFVAAKHRNRLDEGPLVDDPMLRATQEAFRNADGEFERRRHAREFEIRARELAESDPGDERRELRQILGELGAPGSAERTINFFPRFFRHQKGPRAGKRFHLDGFQTEFFQEFHRPSDEELVDVDTGEPIVDPVWGPLRRRTYQRGYLLIPGGNGKTPLAAGDGILGLCELEDAPEIYCIAGAEDQAGIAGAFAASFVKGTDEQPGDLRQWLRVRGNSTIVNRATGGRMEVLPSSGSLQEGRQPSRVIVDELWAIETKPQEATYVAMSGKLHKRPNAYLLGISTAGRGRKSLLYKIVRNALKFDDVTRDGCLIVCRDEEKGILVWIYQSPDDTRVDDLKAIRAVNPAPWLDPRDVLRQAYDEGLGESEVRRLAHNQFVDVKNQWLPMGKFEELAAARKRHPKDGTEIALAFDGSYNNDSTALVGCTRDGHLFVAGVWERPEDEDDAAIWVVPRKEVKRAVDDAMQRWDVRGFVVDPPGWYEEVDEWGRIYGDVMTLVFPTNETRMMAEACREFYSDVVNAGLSHDGNEALIRHMRNAFVKESRDGAYITKEERDSPNKIDLAVAAVLARYWSKRMKKRRKRVHSW